MGANRPVVKKPKRNRRKRDCPSGKVRYRDPGEAKAALRKHRTTSTRQVVPTRWYWCHLCQGWHLTSKPLGVPYSQWSST